MTKATVTEYQPEPRGGIIDSLLNVLLGSIKWQVVIGEGGDRRTYRGRVRRLAYLQPKVSGIVYRHEINRRVRAMIDNQEETP